jgi:hypothetical protein
VPPLRAARLWRSTPEARRSTEQALLARGLPLDPGMPRTDDQVHALCRMLRPRHRAACDTGITAGQGPGGKAWRAVVPGVRKAARARRAGLSLSGRNGPTAGVIPRLNLLKRPAYGRAGVAFWRHRRLATASEEAASSWGRRVVAVGKGLLPGHTGGSFRKPGDAPRPCGPGIDGEASPFHLHREWRRPDSLYVGGEFGRLT